MAAEAVDEVGNPTVLATFAVIAAILPMAMVRGLMGLMRPIPIGASAAMIFSLLVAFAVTPWAAIRFLKGPSPSTTEDEDRGTRLYRRFMTFLLRSKRNQWAFLSLVSVLLILSMSLFTSACSREDALR